MSKKAFQAGLNLVSAARAILMSPAWNPGTDAQAIRRIVRPNQSKLVKIFQLVGTLRAGISIDEKMLVRQASKTKERSQLMNGKRVSTTALRALLMQ
jgi:SNF2 family DNA or RNA helicase